MTRPLGSITGAVLQIPSPRRSNNEPGISQTLCCAAISQKAASAGPGIGCACFGAAPNAQSSLKSTICTHGKRYSSRFRRLPIAVTFSLSAETDIWIPAIAKGFIVCAAKAKRKSVPPAIERRRRSTDADPRLLSFGRALDRALQNLQRFFEHPVGNRQRHQEADDVEMDAASEQQQSFRQREGLDPPCEG